MPPEPTKRHFTRREPATVEEHLSPEQFAELIHVNRVTVYRWIKTGKIRGVKVLGSKCVRIPASAANAFLEGHAVK